MIAVARPGDRLDQDQAGCVDRHERVVGRDTNDPEGVVPGGRQPGGGHHPRGARCVDAREGELPRVRAAIEQEPHGGPVATEARVVDIVGSELVAVPGRDGPVGSLSDHCAVEGVRAVPVAHLQPRPSLAVSRAANQPEIQIGDGGFVRATIKGDHPPRRISPLFPAA